MFSSARTIVSSLYFTEYDTPAIDKAACMISCRNVSRRLEALLRHLGLSVIVSSSRSI